MFHTLQSALESGQEARIVQIGLIGSIIREFFRSFVRGYWRYCVVYVDTVSSNR